MLLADLLRDTELTTRFATCDTVEDPGEERAFALKLDKAGAIASKVAHPVLRSALVALPLRYSEQRRTTEPVRIGGTTDVPAEPAVRLVTQQLGQDRSAASGAELDAAGPVGVLATMPGCADGYILDAVRVEITSGGYHSTEQLARLAPRPEA